MPRRKRNQPAADAPESARPLTVPAISPTDMFTAETFRLAVGLRDSSLRREVREKRLKVRKRCGKYFTLGEDVLAWLRGGAIRRGQDGGE